MNNLPTDEGDKDKNRKISKYRYCGWKNVLTWTKDKEGKTEISGESRNVVWSMRDLDNKGLNQNKVLCSSLRVELPMVNYYTGFPVLFTLGKQIFGYPLTSGSRTVLTWIPPCHFFLIASFDVLILSASSRLPLFLLRGELDCWLGHGWSRIQGCWCYCQLFRLVLVEGADYLLEVHDGLERFPGILFFRITLSCNQIV